jgi:hypothetical protein
VRKKTAAAGSTSGAMTAYVRAMIWMSRKEPKWRAPRKEGAVRIMALSRSHLGRKRPNQRKITNSTVPSCGHMNRKRLVHRAWMMM